MICEMGSTTIEGQEGLEPERYPRDVELANATLIASAPELLEQRDRFREDMLKLAFLVDPDWQKADRRLEASWIVERIRGQNAAIAKIYKTASCCEPANYNPTMTEIIDICCSVTSSDAAAKP